MQYRWPLVSLLVATLVAVGASSAAGGSTDWAFSVDTPREVRLPDAIVPTVEFGELDYEGPPYRGLLADLNGDGVPEHIVQAAPSVCGNGGCPFAIFDGKTLRPLGMVFGGWIVVRATRPGTFPVIHTLSHLSAEAATYTTFEYDGGRYVTRTSVEFRGPALELRRVPVKPTP